MSVIKGYELPVKTHEMSPLDMAIEEFKKQAKDYHQNKKTVCATEEEQKKLDEKLNADFLFLDSQRMTIECMAQVKERLDEYRKQSRRKGALDDLKQEEHHPTDTLQEFMKLEGYPAPDGNCDCHHIIPGTGKDKALAIQARLKLHMCGVGINDPDNGVWLPASMDYVPHWAMKRALPHANIHTKKYDRWVADKMRAARDEVSARVVLGNLRRDLVNGDVPKENLTIKAQKQLQAKMAGA